MRPLLGVSFDCWNTLLYEPAPERTYARRVGQVARVAEELGCEVDLPGAREALDRAWRRHWELWHEEVASGPAEMAAWALEGLLGGPAPPETAFRLACALGEELLDSEVRALPAARETLATLSERGLRCALICDTGFSGGKVVRRLLDRHGLLPYLEVAVFSDEVGLPKPNARPFEAALTPLGLASRPAGVLHVGDLRRTDVAGARNAGMRTARLRQQHDDLVDLPDADHVIDSLGQLLRLLG